MNYVLGFYQRNSAKLTLHSKMPTLCLQINKLVLLLSSILYSIDQTFSTSFSCRKILRSFLGNIFGHNFRLLPNKWAWYTLQIYSYFHFPCLKMQLSNVISSLLLRVFNLSKCPIHENEWMFLTSYKYTWNMSPKRNSHLNTLINPIIHAWESRMCAYAPHKCKFMVLIHI